MLAVIPFSGFYHSVHDSALDDALEQMFTDSSGCHPNVRLIQEAFDQVNWTAVHIEYAKGYAESFGAEFKLPSLKFESLTSPREYNFTTDRIFVELSTEDVERVFDEVSIEDLTETAREMFTSRSGFSSFSSFYSPDWRSWGEPAEWDHNQVLCLLTAMVGDDFDSWREFDLMEDYRGNGHFDNWLFTGAREGLQRIDKIGAYLREREERQWRTAA